MVLIFLIVGLLTGVVLYLHHVNRAMNEVPEEARLLSPRRWTADEIKAAYEKNKSTPVDITKALPPKKRRRYIVVGGSGLVGASIVSHLLTRGEDPTAVRVLDLQPPQDEILERGVAFVKTDIADKAGVVSAFSHPWPSSVAHLALTVFHTAAVIRPFERYVDFLSLCTKVNVDGTKNVVDAAKQAGASCFVSTSSGSVCLHRPSFWIAPWSKYPTNGVQVLSDSSARPRAHDEFFGNYAVSKSIAERIVLEADDPKSKFRTGCIRPANGIYGVGKDNGVTIPTQYLSKGGAPIWTSHIIQNFVNAENVSIAHLLYEQRLIELGRTESEHSQADHKAGPRRPNIGGQAFLVTDPNPAITFGDLYTLLRTVADTPMRLVTVPPVPFLLLAHLLEWYALLQHRYLPRLLPKITGNLAQFQPSLFSIFDVHTIIDDSRARKAPEDGGLGYCPPITTLDGMCMEVAHWNKTASLKTKQELETMRPLQVTESGLDVNIAMPQQRV